MALIKAINYDPPTMATHPTASPIPMTALDTTNLRITFTAPESGNVLVRMFCVEGSSTGIPTVMLGVLEGTTVRARVWANTLASRSSTSYYGRLEAIFTVTGLTPGTDYTWDAAYGVETPLTGFLRYGGPNDSSTLSATGAFLYEIWEA